MLTLQTRDRFVVLSTSATAPDEWTEVYARPRELFGSQMLDAHIRVLRQGDDVFLVSGGGNSKGQVTRYDAAARTWTTITPADAGYPSPLAALPAGALARFDGKPVQGGRFFEVSSDAGAHWERRGEQRHSFGPLLFTSGSIGYVVVNGSLAETDTIGQ